jgi:hypothetical protein
MAFIKWTSALLILLALAVGFHPASAQRGLMRGGFGVYGFGPRLGENVEFALEFQSQLGLTTDQVAALEAIREGIATDVAPLQTELEDLRAQIVSGDRTRIGDLLGVRDLLEAASAPYRAEIAAILSPEQHLALQREMFGTGPWARSGVRGAAPNLGARVGFGLGQGSALGLGRGAGLRLGRGYGAGLGRGAGLGLGRGFGRRAVGRRPWIRRGG